MSFADFLATLDRSGDALVAEIPDSWTQGRTTYGGISATLCLIAAREALPEDRPLRSALVSFVGPSAGQVCVKTDVLRSGRTASAVRAALTSDAGQGLETSFTFGAGRDSVLSLPGLGLPDGVTAPPKGAAGGPFPPGAPSFTQNFELFLAAGALPFSGQAGHEPMRFWTRHRDPAAWFGLDALFCLADALPPAITTHLTEFAPLSSMTWMIDLLSEDVSTEEGWYLLETTPDHAADGYSAQTMTIWSTDGRCLIKGRQMVTVFA